MATTKQSVSQFGQSLLQTLAMLNQEFTRNKFQDILRGSSNVNPVMGDPATIPIAGGAPAQLPRFQGTQTTFDPQSALQQTQGDPQLLQMLTNYLGVMGSVQPKYSPMNLGQGGVGTFKTPFMGAPSFETVREPRDPMKDFAAQERFRTDENIRQFQSTQGTVPRVDKELSEYLGMDGFKRVIMQRADGSTYEQVGQSEVRPSRGSVPTQEQVKFVSQTNQFIKDLDELESAATQNPNFVGVYDSAVGAVKEKMGGISPKEARFRQIVAGLRNQILNIRSGAAVSPAEFDRIIEELPDPSTDEVTFIERVKKTRDNLRYMLNLYEQQTGRKASFDSIAPISPRQSRFEIIDVK